MVKSGVTVMEGVKKISINLIFAGIKLKLNTHRVAPMSRLLSKSSNPQICTKKGEFRFSPTHPGEPRGARCWSFPWCQAQIHPPRFLKARKDFS